MTFQEAIECAEKHLVTGERVDLGEAYIELAKVLLLEMAVEILEGIENFQKEEKE